MADPKVPYPSPLFVILPWEEVAGEHGFDPRSPYVERFWLGTLGPSTTFLLRHLVGGLDVWPEGYELDLPATAAALGLTSLGPQGAFARALQRLVQFGLAHPHGHGLVVRRVVPPLSARHVAKLPPHLQDEHRRWLAAGSDPRVADRARLLAHALRAAGADRRAVAVELEVLGIPRAIARQAA
jgi:hypothetical protein